MFFLPCLSDLPFSRYKQIGCQFLLTSKQTRIGQCNSANVASLRTFKWNREYKPNNREHKPTKHEQTHQVCTTFPQWPHPRKQRSLEVGLAWAIRAGTQYHCNNTLYAASKMSVLKEHLAAEDKALLQSAGSLKAVV